MTNLKKHIFLLLSLLLVMAAGLNFWFFEKDAPRASEHHYVSTIRSNIQSEIFQVEQVLNLVSKKIKSISNESFASFQTNSDYPFFVFKNKRLIYWSDNRFVPDYQVFNQSKDVCFLDTESGFYVAYRKNFVHLGNHIEVYGLVNLYRKYRNENDYLKSGFNGKIFLTEPKSINGVEHKSKFLNIYAPNGSFLFSVEPPQLEKIDAPNIPINTLILLGLAIATFGIYIVIWINNLRQQHHFGRGFVLLFFYFAFIRLIMLTNSIPMIFSDSLLFNPKFLVINELAPSLGDALINAMVVLVWVSYLVAHIYRSSVYYRLLKSSRNLQNVVSVLLVVLSLWASYFAYRNLCNIYEKSQFTLDLSLSITFSTLKLATLAFYICVLFVYFLAFHLLVSLFLRLNKLSKLSFYKFLIGYFIGLASLVLVDEFRLIYLSSGIYFLVIYFNKFPRLLYSFKYRTTIYFFSGALVFALMAMYVIRTEEQKKDYYDKQNFGQKYLAENDFLGEGLLSRVVQTVASDTLVKRALLRKSLAREEIQQIVKSKHLDLYFDRYDTDVMVFDKNGISLDSSAEMRHLSFYQQSFQQPTYRTLHPSIFFVNDVGNNFIKQYLTFIPIGEGGNRVGFVLLDLKFRDEFAQSVYPELLLDKKFTQTPDTKNYSYAIYDKNLKLIFSSGSYNYVRKLPQSLLLDSLLFEKGIKLNDYMHVGKIGQNGRKIVVSSKYREWNNLFSNFSFLFLLSVISIILVMLAYAVRYRMKSLNVNFATKIQLFLNAAFLLPLLLVIIITLSVIDSTFVSNQEKSYLDNTKNITSTVQLQLENFAQKRISRAFLEQEINDLARDTKLDINYYNLNGQLNLSTRPLVYEYGLLSRYMNPTAYSRIIEEKENEILLSESLGGLFYKTAYMSIKGRDNKIMGVIGIPFFDAKPTLDRQVTEVVASILSIFAWLFLLLLILSYFASNILTNPLKLVAQKLKRTSLDKLNERLDWNSDDEIGMLVREYNKMLGKLEESKVALSMSEKQTAWREMAKQVAHEIKNPLTPMKLSIQQLQRTLVLDSPKSKERIGRALSSLTEQIDNISEIANSFSEFAKMPVPRNEVFDLVPLIQKSADLYADDERISLNAYIKEKEAWVLGDRQFMSRVITNLIINGIQSVPAEKRAIINLRLYKNEDDNMVIMEIQDNGSGIPENIRQRVFIPNFTTKVGGSGLGLAMARRGVEHAGGNIWFETISNKGTTFFIDLPLVNKK